MRDMTRDCSKCGGTPVVYECDICESPLCRGCILGSMSYGLETHSCAGGCPPNPATVVKRFGSLMKVSCGTCKFVGGWRQHFDPDGFRCQKCKTLTRRIVERPEILPTHPCPECKGERSVTMLLTPRPTDIDQRTKDIDCPTCGGVGWKEEEQCHYCDKTVAIPYEDERPEFEGESLYVCPDCRAS